jgi:putative membrane protein
LWCTSGGLLLAALWLGPLPEMSRVSFTAHMILHLGVFFAAAPILAAGLAAAGLFLGEARPILTAVAISLAELVIVWGWHAPAMHQAAALDPRYFAAQQASFLGIGAAIWLVSFGPGRRGAAAGVLAMLMSFMHMSMLGVLLGISGPLYPAGICGGLFGLDPLADQHVGGALMATAALAYLGGGLFAASRLLADGPASPRGT